MAIVALFTLGSGICGGASSGAMLIAGRAVQGMGSGGINMIVDIIVSDLVPLRERGNYMAMVLTVYFVGTSLGPFVGGAIVDSTTWRWVRMGWACAIPLSNAMRICGLILCVDLGLLYQSSGNGILAPPSQELI